jgi:hypothetical protein
MNQLEVLLGLSAIQAEMMRLANALGLEGGRIVRYAARVLNLLGSVSGSSATRNRCRD